MIDILTGTAFDARKRLNRREDEVALEFPSSVSSRRRGLLALRAQNWRASGGGGGWEPTPNAYVETDGVCYIDTGWSPTVTSSYSADLAMLGTNVICGSMGAGGSKRFYAWSSSGQLYCGAINPVTKSGVTFRSRTVFGCDCPGQTATIDGTDFEIGAQVARDLPTFVIGGRHNGTTIDYKGVTRIWKLTAWDNGTLVHDFYPREMDGIAGLWDVVTEQFVTATGGALSYGISAT